jgi:hypothetical protein
VKKEYTILEKTNKYWHVFGLKCRVKVGNCWYKYSYLKVTLKEKYDKRE